MKPKSTLRSFLILTGSTLLAVSYAHAASVTWDTAPGTVGLGDSAVTGGTGAWIEDLTTGNWTTDGGVNNIAWVNANNDTAVFGDTAGTVTIDAAGVTVGGLQFNSAGYTISGGTLTFGAAGSINANADATISAPLAGSAALAKDGDGILTLSGANTSYTGALTLNAGTVRANTSANALGGGAATLTLGGGSLVFNHSANLAFNRNTTVTADSTIQSSRDAAGAGLSYTLGTLGIGTNKLTIGAGVTTSGTAALTFGTTTLGGNATFEVINGAGSTGQLALGAVGETGGPQNLTKEGAGVLDLSTSNSYSGTTTVTGGVLRLSNTTSLPGGIAATGGNSALTLDGGAVELASGDFFRDLGTGSTQFQITGGASGFSARTAARIVNLNNDSHQITWGSSTFNPSTFVLNASTANNTLNFQNPIDLGGSARTISVAANTATLSGGISNGGLIKTGAGTLALSVANIYSGGTTLNGGTVAISNATSFGSGNVSVTGSSRINSTAGNGVAITYANAIDVGAALSLQNPQTATGATATFSGQLTGSNAITIVNGGGNGLLAGLAFTHTNNTFTGDVIMPSGSVAGDDRFSFNSIGDGGKFTFRKRGHQSAFIYTGSSAITFNTRQIALAADFGGSPFDGGGTTPINRFMNNATDPTHTVTFNTSIAPATVHASSSGYLFFDGSNMGNNTFAGTIPNMLNQNLNIGKNGTGKWILTGSNTYSGNTLVSNGTLSVGSMDVVANAQPLGQGTIIQLGNSSTSGTLEYTGSGNATTDKQIVLGNPTNNNQSGAGSIVNNSPTGTLTFSNPTFNSIAGSTLTTRDRTLTLGGSNASANTISGTIQDYVSGAAQISLTKADGGTWRLSGANTYTGNTTINSGVLLANHANAIPAASGISINGDGAILGLGAADFTLLPNGLTVAAGKIAFVNNGGFAAYGADRIVNFGGANGIVAIGATTTANIGSLNGKALHLGAPTATHKVTVTNTLDFGDSDRTIVVNDGAAPVDAEISGVLQGQAGSTVAALTKSGTGTLVLSAANTYTGGTTVSAGTLTINGSLADATMSIASGATVNGSGTLTFNINGTTADQVVDGGAMNISGLTVAVNPTGAGLTETSYVLVDATGGGAISGSFAGVSGAPGYVLDYGTANQVKLVQSAGSAYTTWAGGAAFTDDANGDGVKNGLAWFLGATDKDVSALNKLPAVSTPSGYLQLDFNRVNPYSPAKLYLEYGNDLVGWTKLEIPSGSGTIGGDIEVTVSAGSPSPVQIKIPTVTHATGGKLFARLSATEN